MTDEEYANFLRAQGAREFEVVALQMDQKRGLAAVALAIERGADRPIPYALKMFDDPDWQAVKEKSVLKTNQSVDKSCPHCGGDRFVLVTDGSGLWEETYAPCKECNSKVNTWREVGNERRMTQPQ